MKSPFENFKKADWVFFGCGIVVLIVLILVTLGANKYLSKSPVIEEQDITFTVFFRGVTITDTISPFKIGENSFITIRNVPYTKLEITDVKFDRRKMFVATDKSGQYKIVEDISTPALYDFEVTLKDKAKITDDGAVVGGNKIKMGIPVILEGKNYKFNGVVSNVQFLNENKNENIPEEQKNEQ